MTPHTPEPWKIDPVPPLAIIEDDEDGVEICTLYPREEAQANAHLLRAAPKLLAQLKTLVEVANTVGVVPNGETIADAEAAIRAAEGETP